MIHKWPYKPPYAQAAARLREAIAIAALQDAVTQLAAQMAAASVSEEDLA